MQRCIIDVREPYEFDRGHVEGAVNMPPSDLLNGAEALKDVPMDAEIVLYCLSGSRSAVAANIIRSMGYTNVVNGISKGQVAAKYNLKI